MATDTSLAVAASVSVSSPSTLHTTSAQHAHTLHPHALHPSMMPYAHMAMPSAALHHYAAAAYAYSMQQSAAVVFCQTRPSSSATTAPLIDVVSSIVRSTASRSLPRPRRHGHETHRLNAHHSDDSDDANDNDNAARASSPKDATDRAGLLVESGLAQGSLLPQPTSYASAASSLLSHCATFADVANSASSSPLSTGLAAMATRATSSSANLLRPCSPDSRSPLALLSHNTSSTSPSSSPPLAAISKSESSPPLGPPSMQKPRLSYAQLICRAIVDSAEQRRTLAHIYLWIQKHYPFFRTAETGWQNSIRHNLSTNKCFIKVPRPKDVEGKGCFWTVDPVYVDALLGADYKRQSKMSKRSSYASVSQTVALPGFTDIDIKREESGTPLNPSSVKKIRYNTYPGTSPATNQILSTQSISAITSHTSMILANTDSGHTTSTPLSLLSSTVGNFALMQSNIGNNNAIEPMIDVVSTDASDMVHSLLSSANDIDSSLTDDASLLTMYGTDAIMNTTLKDNSSSAVRKKMSSRRTRSSTYLSYQRSSRGQGIHRMSLTAPLSPSITPSFSFLSAPPSPTYSESVTEVILTTPQVIINDDSTTISSTCHACTPPSLSSISTTTAVSLLEPPYILLTDDYHHHIHHDHSTDNNNDYELNDVTVPLRSSNDNAPCCIHRANLLGPSPSAWLTNGTPAPLFEYCIMNDDQPKRTHNGLNGLAHQRSRVPSNTAASSLPWSFKCSCTCSYGYGESTLPWLLSTIHSDEKVQGNSSVLSQSFPIDTTATEGMNTQYVDNFVENTDTTICSHDSLSELDIHERNICIPLPDSAAEELNHDSDTVIASTAVQSDAQGDESNNPFRLPVTKLCSKDKIVIDENDDMDDDNEMSISNDASESRYVIATSPSADTIDPLSPSSSSALSVISSLSGEHDCITIDQDSSSDTPRHDGSWQSCVSDEDTTLAIATELHSTGMEAYAALSFFSLPTPIPSSPASPMIHSRSEGCNRLLTNQSVIHTNTLEIISPDDYAMAMPITPSITMPSSPADEQIERTKVEGILTAGDDISSTFILSDCSSTTSSLQESSQQQSIDGPFWGFGLEDICWGMNFSHVHPIPVPLLVQQHQQWRRQQPRRHTLSYTSTSATAAAIAATSASVAASSKPLFSNSFVNIGISGHEHASPPHALMTATVDCTHDSIVIDGSLSPTSLS